MLASFRVASATAASATSTATAERLQWESILAGVKTVGWYENHGETNRPALVIVGGFLGAGKTTLILKAAELLSACGKRPAIILNDQDSGLVDTQHAIARGNLVREVADGCFCCRFSEFIAAAAELTTYKPDVIFAEPVGSCTDLCATVIRPIQDLYGEHFRVASLTVLVDPNAAQDCFGPDVNSHLRYLAEHQLREADVVCTTREDLCRNAPDLPFPIDFRLSGLTGQGVREWLEEVLHSQRIPGTRPLDIDYKQYAEAEAALGWLNMHAQVDLVAPLSPSLLCGPLLDSIEAALTQVGITIAHLKILDRTSAGWIKASICTNSAEPVPEGDLLADPSTHHEFALNLRALARPEQLEELVSASVARLDGDLRITHFHAFSPPAPRPEHRRPK